MRVADKRSPSFSGLRAASRSSSYAKKRNRNCDTAQELTLRKLLWKCGLRYRKNVKTLPGKPDIVFVGQRIAVFCDGDYWHGRHWRRLSAKLRVGTNASYWVQKILSNRRRDRKAEKLLRREGWTVLRFWETDFHHN